MKNVVQAFLLVVTIYLGVNLLLMLVFFTAAGGVVEFEKPKVDPNVEPTVIDIESLMPKAQLPKTSSCPCVNCGCPLCVCEVQKTTSGCKCDKCQCAKPQEAKEITAYIEFHTSPACSYCQTWKAAELPRLKNAGWIEGAKGHVRVIEYGDDGWPGALPMFRFFWQGRMVHEHSGYLTSAEIGATFQRLKRGREVIRSSGVSVRSIAGVIAPGGTSSRSASVLHDADFAGARMPLAGFCVGGRCR